MPRRPLVLVTGLVAAGVLVAALSAARGDLDPTFGSGGKVRTDFGGSEIGRAVAIQRDGMVVVVGDRSDPGPHDFVLARYTVRGKLDPRFDGDGKVATDFGGASDGAFDVAIQGDGKIVVAGSSRQGDRSAIALGRYNRDGTLDQTFGDGGRVLTRFDPDSDDLASAVLVQPDGKIVAAGATRGEFASEFALARFLPNGALDPDFGTGGRVSTPIPDREDDRVYALAIEADGQLVASGGSFEGPSDVVVVRYNADGSLDSGFGADGIVVASFAPRDMVPLHLIVQRDGKLLATGYGGLTRFNRDGGLDRSFGESGRAYAGDVEPGTAAFQPDGKILVIGTVVSDRPASGDFGVARLTTGGTLDLAYGRRGTVVTPFSSGSHDEALDGVLLRDGKLVVSGMTGPAPGTETWGPWDFAVARYLAIRPCVVPSVRGRTLPVARARLLQAGCRLGSVRWAYSRTVERGRVISQKPRARARLTGLAKVDLVVSRGPAALALAQVSESDTDLPSPT